MGWVERFSMLLHQKSYMRTYDFCDPFSAYQNKWSAAFHHMPCTFFLKISMLALWFHVQICITLCVITLLTKEVIAFYVDINSLFKEILASFAYFLLLGKEKYSWNSSKEWSSPFEGARLLNKLFNLISTKSLQNERISG